MPDAQKPDFEARLADLGSPVFTELRPGQKLTLDAYSANHTSTADVAIEMPTGEGKTLVALLIADWALDQGHSVAYLTGTRQLAERVDHEAQQLNLDVVRFTGGDYGGAKLDDYHQAQRVGVMNYWVYFNAKPVPEPADLVIFDDAHLAEPALSGLRTLRIPAGQGDAGALYQEICDQILHQTNNAYPELLTMRDGLALPGTPPELISFSDWAKVDTAVRSAIDDSSYSNGSAVRHTWATLRSHLSRCGALIGPSAVEIRPYHPPTQTVRGYADAQQRIYLSATLGSMEDLQRRIGSHQIERLIPASQLPAGTTGSRQFILNSSGKAALENDTITWALAQTAAAGGRAAWLCASNAEADQLEGILNTRGQRVFRLRAGDDDQVEHWISAGPAHLVTAGRYDGLDLVGDICKLVFITSVPRASSEYERFVVAYLGDATFMRHRVGQRVTQALGRANRVATDRSLYIGLDPAFAQVLADSAVQKAIPSSTTPITRSALELYDEGWEATKAAAAAFWTSPSSATPPPATPARRRPGRSGNSSESGSASDEVAAATSLWLGDHAAAAKSAKEASRLLTAGGESEHGAFWRYVEAHAHFDRGRPEDLTAARQAVDEAVRNGPQTAWFRRLSRTSASLAGKSTSTGDHDRVFLKWEGWRRDAGPKLDRQLARGRKLLTGTHDEQCEGLIYLARLLGVDAKRPSDKVQSATDCHWTWAHGTNSCQRMWEVKTAVTGTSKRYFTRTQVNQVLGQVVAEDAVAPNTTITGCLLDPATEANEDAVAAAVDRIRLVNHQAVVTLYDLLSERFRAYAKDCGDGSAEARGEARSNAENRLPTDTQLMELTAPAGGEVLFVDEVVALFPTE